MAATGILSRLTEGWNPYDPARLKPRPDGI
jgi:hypothetical protein